MKYGQLFLLSSVNSSTRGRGGGLEMVSSLDWNVAPLWFWRTLEIIDEFRQWSQSEKKKKHGDAAGIKIDVSFIAQLERWQWEKRLAERRDLFLWTLWFTNRSPVLVTVAARRPLKCDEWLLLVGHLLALSCNQSRIVLSCLSCLCLSHSTWTVIVLAVNSNHSLLMFMSKKKKKKMVLGFSVQNVIHAVQLSIAITFIFMFFFLFSFLLYSSVCNLASNAWGVDEGLETDRLCTIVKLNVQRSECLPPTAEKKEIVFDKLVKEQKNTSHFVSFLFCSFFSRERKKQLSSAEQLLVRLFEKIGGARQSMKVIASQRSNHIYPVSQLKVSLAFKLPNKIAINRNQWVQRRSAQTLHFGVVFFFSTSRGCGHMVGSLIPTLLGMRHSTLPHTQRRARDVLTLIICRPKKTPHCCDNF